MKHISLNKKSMRETTISEWCRPEGYDLSAVSLSSPLYTSTLNLLYGPYKEARRYIQQRCEYDIGDKEPKGMFVYSHDKLDKEFEGRIYFLIILKNEWMAEDYATIVHELHHFTHIALHNIGIKHCEDSEEAFAYFQGYFMERVIRSFMELKRIKTPKKLKKRQ
jgi:hypothetical protein